MVQRVDTAFAKAQKTPQLSFGQDGVTVQQPVVSFLFPALYSLRSYLNWAVRGGSFRPITPGIAEAFEIIPRTIPTYVPCSCATLALL